MRGDSAPLHPAGNRVRTFAFTAVATAVLGSAATRADLVLCEAGTARSRIVCAEAADQALALFQGELNELLIPLTDGLRTMVLCDHQEGSDSSQILQHAQDLGLLLSDRNLPMPHTFIDLVRRLGQAYGLLSPPPAKEEVQ